MNDNTVTAVIIILLFVLGYCAKVIISFLRTDQKLLLHKGITKINQEIAISTIKTIAETTVGKLESIYAKELRQKVKSGDTSESELYAVAEEAYNEVMSTVCPELINDLKKSITDVELYIRNQIETQLLLIKVKSTNSS